MTCIAQSSFCHSHNLREAERATAAPLGNGSGSEQDPGTARAPFPAEDAPPAPALQPFGRLCCCSLGLSRFETGAVRMLRFVPHCCLCSFSQHLICYLTPLSTELPLAQKWRSSPGALPVERQFQHSLFHTQNMKRVSLSIYLHWVDPGPVSHGTAVSRCSSSEPN